MTPFKPRLARSSGCSRTGGPTRIKDVSLVGLSVRDQEAALDFWVNKVGCEVRLDSTIDTYRWPEVAPPGAEVRLALTKATEEDEIHVGRLAGFALEPDDIDATYGQLPSHGVEFTEAPFRAAMGNQAQCVDPDGHIFALVQP
jgi:predicted enzyme related to lactoylglutathione lyase